MQLKPVKKTKQPEYPVLEYYGEHPQLLNKSVPKNWLKSKVVALSLASFVLCGCGRCSQKIAPIKKIGSEKIDATQDTVNLESLFSGAIDFDILPDDFPIVGMAASEIFLSEEDIRCLILDELKEYSPNVEIEDQNGILQGTLSKDYQNILQEKYGDVLLENLYIHHRVLEVLIFNKNKHFVENFVVSETIKLELKEEKKRIKDLILHIETNSRNNK